MLKSYCSSCQELETAGKSNQRMQYKIQLAARRQRIVQAGYSCSISFYFFIFLITPKRLSMKELVTESPLELNKKRLQMMDFW